MLVKNKNDKDFTEITKVVYNQLREKYGNYGARISDMFQLLKDAFGISEFELLNTKLINNGAFESYLMDRQVDWMQGKDIDFGDIYEAILTAGDFTKTERDLFEMGKVEERLWAIYLLICNPELGNGI